MAEAKMHLPVFLPGSDHDWEEIAGVATISDTGEINIQLQRPEHGMELVRQAKTGRLFSCSFDYLTDEKETS